MRSRVARVSIDVRLAPTWKSVFHIKKTFFFFFFSIPQAVK